MVQYVEEDFAATDADKDGFITAEEIKDHWFNYDYGDYGDDYVEMTDEEIAAEQFEYYDQNGDGMLVPEEFVGYDEDCLAAMYEMHDNNEDGQLSPEEWLEYWLAEPEEMTEEEWDEMMENMPKNRLLKPIPTKMVFLHLKSSRHGTSTMTMMTRTKKLKTVENMFCEAEFVNLT